MTTETEKLRIGIIGTGAIGGFYGVMLARAGFDVHFLLRGEFNVVLEKGLTINSAEHGVLTLNPVQAYSSAADMPPCDWLLVSTKTTDNASLAPLIIQAAAPGAKVLLLQNGLEVEDSLRPLLPDSLHLLGGLCFICVHRTAPGVVMHQAFGAVTLGYHSGSVSDPAAGQMIAEQGAELFRKAGLESRTMANVHLARWQKLVWNIPYNGLSVLLKASTAGLMGDPNSRDLVQALMNEVVQGALACGQMLPDGYAEQLFAATEKMPDYWPSMYLDYQEKRPLELTSIYERPLLAALTAGHDMPKVRALHQALAFIDTHNG
ncbi:putative 2-dehydropantoate 2-reductase [Pseudomonas sp. 10B1]|uniref:putative 2-dehydropantoate 2-reductase n=1 Tax=unclassified Pseudomonas TaxID=196821 RepID=UPI002AB50DAA|nr:MULTISPECIES: putative 2-dehydropantoate 2-reductase [unclassified Pseudomonas]MDY7560545.1 putative 2-dehydropantoate 2-reductase [Pseudomonas sp. AB6]MEA9975861.1 putative 2-dehydropantoate 2-reductase [Pseudomonas sp. RTS4]MEA9993301.1 putative 2-dehydropantoate 2-reductase [Pseudomonas sp. AA4]MEB0088172.1 putative 2-dehydropantoate 2-reductase [Pseudomonas sp. RTI1]MEB0124212.1 putative 2-dehydropantoate 2-reductase [Pseudomonas sp. CCC1.2]